MTFQQLQFVLEVARLGSINKASEKLYMHQSNVGNAIKQLEDELGIQIFHRTQRGVSVTKQGKEFLTYAEDIIGKKTFIENRYSVRSRSFLHSFSVSSMRAWFLTKPIINSWDGLIGSQEAPAYIRLSKRSFDDVLEDVSSYQADIGLVFVSKSQKKKIALTTGIKNLNYYEIGVSHLNIVMRKDHPVLERNTLDQITEYPYVIAEEKENYSYLYDEATKAIFELLQKAPKIIISTNDSTTCQDIVAETDAFYIASMYHQRISRYRFRSIPLSGDDAELTHYYVTRKDQDISPFMNRYIEELQKLYGSL